MLTFLSITGPLKWGSVWTSISTGIEVMKGQTRTILSTKHPKLTMLFYYLKVPVPFSHQSSILALIGALKWGIVWTSISIGIEIRKGQTWIYVLY